MDSDASKLHTFSRDDIRSKLAERRAEFDKQAKREVSEPLQPVTKKRLREQANAKRQCHNATTPANSKKGKQSVDQSPAGDVKDNDSTPNDSPRVKKRRPTSVGAQVAFAQFCLTKAISPLLKRRNGPTTIGVVIGAVNANSSHHVTWKATISLGLFARFVRSNTIVFAKKKLLAYLTLKFEGKLHVMPYDVDSRMKTLDYFLSASWNTLTFLRSKMC